MGHAGASTLSSCHASGCYHSPLASRPVTCTTLVTIRATPIPASPHLRLPIAPHARRRTPPGKCGGGVWWRGCGFGSRGRGGRWLGCCSKGGGGARRATRRRRALRACQDSSTTRAASRHPACRRGSVDAVTSLACAWVSMAWPVHAWVDACRVSSGPSLRLDSASSAVCCSRLHPCSAPDSDPPGTSWLFSPAVAHGRLSLPAVACLARGGRR
jgi:hypothetical protein